MESLFLGNKSTCEVLKILFGQNAKKIKAFQKIILIIGFISKIQFPKIKKEGTYRFRFLKHTKNCRNIMQPIYYQGLSLQEKINSEHK